MARGEKTQPWPYSPHDLSCLINQTARQNARTYLLILESSQSLIVTLSRRTCSYSHSCSSVSLHSSTVILTLLTILNFDRDWILMGGWWTLIPNPDDDDVYLCISMPDFSL